MNDKPFYMNAPIFSENGARQKAIMAGGDPDAVDIEFKTKALNSTTIWMDIHGPFGTGDLCKPFNGIIIPNFTHLQMI